MIKILGLLMAAIYLFTGPCFAAVPSGTGSEPPTIQLPDFQTVATKNYEITVIDSQNDNFEGISIVNQDYEPPAASMPDASVQVCYGNAGIDDITGAAGTVSFSAPPGS